MRRVQYKWLGKTWTMDLHSPGDPVSDAFSPPNAMALIPWNLASRQGCFVDVGAHVGTVAVHASPFFKSVLAFEPEARNLKLLQNNILQNKLPNIAVVPKAVSDRSGTTTFYISDSVDTSRNSLMPSKSGGTVDVPLVSLDDAFASEYKQLLPLAFIKIDVEGFEPQVIKGAAKTISSQTIKPIMTVEFAPARWVKNEDDFAWLIEFLRAQAYIPYLPTSGFISPITIDMLAELYRSWKGLPYEAWVDLVLIPADRSSSAHISNAHGLALKMFQQIG